MSDFVGVTLKELDYSTSVQTQSASGAGFAGGYAWGPIEQARTITTLDNYALNFGKPIPSNKVSYLTAASYLDYSDALRVVRVAGEGTLNATSTNYDYAKYKLSSVLGTIEVGSTFTTTGTPAVTASVVSYDEGTSIIEVAKANGLLQSNDNLVFANNATATIESIVHSQYVKLTVDVTAGTFVVDSTITSTNGSATLVSINDNQFICLMDTGSFVNNTTITQDSASANITKIEYVDYGEGGILIKNQKLFENMLVPYKFAARYAGEYGNSIMVSVANSETFSSWQYRSMFDGAPEAGEIHLVVVDVDGVFYNSYAGNILSRYSYLSLTEGAQDEQGQDIYYKKVINNQDSYIYVGAEALEAIDFINGVRLAGGKTVEPSDADIIAGYNLFSDQEEENSLYVFGANYSPTVINSIISMIDKRQDLLGIFSPSSLNLLQHANINDNVDALINWADSITMSNRVFLDSNWMYYYNQFDNEYVWIPMAGATTGVNSRCDTNNNPWDSPMGFTRGTYLNVAQLAWQPDKEARTAIYARSINPIYVSNQAGVVLMGDRTHVIKQSYFRQMAARKTLIIIERGAVAYLMFYLGENNNRQTRQLVTSNLSSWLRTLGAAGAFRLAQVICNESNNPQQIIDEQKMRVLIRLLLQSSINTIELQIAVVNNVAVFTENVIQGIF